MCSVDYTIKDSNSSIIFFILTSVSAFWSNWNLLLFYLTLPAKPFCSCPVCKRQQTGYQLIATAIFSWCSFLFLPACSLCESIVTTKLEDSKMPTTSLLLQVDKKEGRNVTATSATSVMRCSSERASTLCMSPGRVCLRETVPVLYHYQFPSCM